MPQPKLRKDTYIQVSRVSYLLSTPTTETYPPKYPRSDFEDIGFLINSQNQLEKQKFRNCHLEYFDI